MVTLLRVRQSGHGTVVDRLWVWVHAMVVGAGSGGPMGPCSAVPHPPNNSSFAGEPEVNPMMEAQMPDIFLLLFFSAFFLLLASRYEF